MSTLLFFFPFPHLFNISAEQIFLPFHFSSRSGARSPPARCLCHLLSSVSSLLRPGMLPGVGYTLCPGKKPFLWSTHLFTKSTEKMPQPTLSALPGFILILFFLYYWTSYNLHEEGIKGLLQTQAKGTTVGKEVIVKDPVISLSHHHCGMIFS